MRLMKWWWNKKKNEHDAETLRKRWKMSDGSVAFESKPKSRLLFGLSQCYSMWMT